MKENNNNNNMNILIINTLLTFSIFHYHKNPLNIFPKALNIIVKSKFKRSLPAFIYIDSVLLSRSRPRSVDKANYDGRFGELPTTGNQQPAAAMTP